MNSSRCLSSTSLPEDLRDMVEKEFVKRIVFKIVDAELRLTGCTPVKELTQADVGKLRQVSGVIIRFDEERRIDIIKDAWYLRGYHYGKKQA